MVCCCLVATLCPTLATPWTVASQAPLSMRFPRQEYWSGLSFPSPGDLPNPGMEPESPALSGGLFTTEPPGKLRSSKLKQDKPKETHTQPEKNQTANNLIIQGFPDD